MAVPAGHGAQINLVGDAKLAAQGAYATTLLANDARRIALVQAGTMGDGSTYNGATSTGAAPYDAAYTNGENAVLSGGVEDTITAHAGGTQAAAYVLTKSVSRVTVVATAADSVRLKAVVPGEMVIVINSDSTDSLQVFAASTGTINGVATATGVALAAGKVGIYFAVTATTLYGGALA